MNTMSPVPHQFDASSIALKEVQPFAEGGHRFCFQHPQNAALCIKVNKPGMAKKIWADQPFYKKVRPVSDFDDNQREFKAYLQKAIAQGGEVVWTHLTRCYGWQGTDIGPGLVSDYFAKADGSPADTLEFLLHRDGVTDVLLAALEELATYLRETQLMTKNILPHNLVMAIDGKLKIIDGLGILGAIPITQWHRKTAENYIERRIERMFLRVDWEVSDKSTGWRKTEKQGRIA